MLAKKELQLLFWIDPDLEEHFVSDYMRLKQVLINFMRNSVKFTNEGSIRLICRKIELTEITKPEEVKD